MFEYLEGVLAEAHQRLEASVPLGDLGISIRERVFTSVFSFVGEHPPRPPGKVDTGERTAIIESKLLGRTCVRFNRETDREDLVKKVLGVLEIYVSHTDKMDPISASEEGNKKNEEEIVLGILREILEIKHGEGVEFWEAFSVGIDDRTANMEYSRYFQKLLFGGSLSDKDMAHFDSLSPYHRDTIYCDFNSVRYGGAKVNASSYIRSGERGLLRERLEFEVNRILKESGHQ